MFNWFIPFKFANEKDQEETKEEARSYIIIDEIKYEIYEVIINQFCDSMDFHFKMKKNDSSLFNDYIAYIHKKIVHKNFFIKKYVVEFVLGQFPQYETTRIKESVYIKEVIEGISRADIDITFILSTKPNIKIKKNITITDNTEEECDKIANGCIGSYITKDNMEYECFMFNKKEVKENIVFSKKEVTCEYELCYTII